MNRRHFRRSVAVFCAAACMVLTAGAAWVAGQPAAGQTTAKDVKDTAAETARAIKGYSIEQRDEAVRKAKAALDDLDARISRSESQISEKWNQMDQSARQKSRDALAALRQKRNEAGEWYGGLRHGSRKAWEDVKTGFVKSYQDLRGAFDKLPHTP